MGLGVAARLGQSDGITVLLSLPPPSVGSNVRFVTDDPIKPNRNPIKFDGISMQIQAPTSTEYAHVRYS